MSEAGLFIAIEGPNGVGKSDAASGIALLLEAEGLCVCRTAEPTRTPLGMALRQMEGELSGYALALGCAADRTDHVAREILPTLDQGGCVLSDRYVASSLVLQRVDGLPLEEIWKLNCHLPVPDLTIYLDDRPEMIEKRRTRRAPPTPLEARLSPAQERDWYAEAREFLEAHGWRSSVLDCDGMNAGDVAAEGARRVLAVPWSDSSFR